MREGELVAGRWRLIAEAPGEGAVRRFRAVAVDTGEPAEVLGLRAGATPDAKRAFVRAHRALAAARDPALATTLAVVDEGEVAVVRAPLEDATLADVGGPLPAAVVAAIGARLLPAVLAAGGATQGALLGTDVGLDERGSPTLAPRARPLNRVDRSILPAVAPETFGGADPDGAAGLYGLGALLFRLASGRELPGGAPRADRPPPPPASAFHHAVPAELDAAIAALLSSRPTDRASALPKLLNLEGPLVDLRDHLRRQAPSLPATTASTVARAPAAPRGDARVVIPGKALATLDPAARSAAAGLAGLPVSEVDGLADAGLPLVVERHAGLGAARRRAEELSRDAGLPLLVVSTRSIAPPLVAVATAASVVLCLIVGMIGMATGLLPLAVVAFALAGVAGVAGGWVWGRTSAGNLLVDATRRSERQTDPLVAELTSDGLLGPSWRQLAQVRRALGTSELPATAAGDLRGLLRDVERRLTAMAEVARAADRALAGVDAPRLRTRLAALGHHAKLDPDQLAERDRLTRALADLDEVERRRRTLAEEARRIDGTLHEVAAALARASATDDGGAEEALEKLVRTTTLAREATTSTATPPSRATSPARRPEEER